MNSIGEPFPCEGEPFPHETRVRADELEGKMTELLKTLPYWEKLTDEEKKLTSESAYIRHYVTSEELYGPCVDCVGMIHIVKGEARAYLLSDEGREITLFHVSEGDNCVLSASCVLAHIRFESHMNVTKPSDILIVPVKVFGDLFERNVYVRCFAYEVATRRFSSVVSVMEQTMFARIDKRLAGCLLRLFRETGNAEIRITQEQLALRVNTVRETVSRTLKRFSAEDVIEIRRGTILLKDIRKLEEAAE